MNFTYCPKCRHEMMIGDQGYNYCQNTECNFIQYSNPTPVVAAVIEYGSDQVILAHNKMWPRAWFGLITGFLEKNEHPEDCVLREVKEEVGLDGTILGFIGHYTFDRMNQIIMAYHVKTEEDPIVLDDELDDYRIVAFDQVKYWPAGTGYALKDFLERRGFNPVMQPFS